MSVDLESFPPLVSTISDPEFLPLIKNFTRTIPGKISEIQIADGAKRFDELSFLAHRLRGAASFGFEEVGNLAGQIEDDLLNGNKENLVYYLDALIRLGARIEVGLAGDSQQSRVSSGDNV